VVVVWYLAVIAVEAVVLWLMRWAGFWRSLLAAFLMNTLTTLVGFFLAGALVFTYDQWLWLLSWFIAWVLSVVLEWGVLALMDRTKLRRAFVASLLANTVTYLALMVFYLIYAFVLS
jgi:hypothetical protein